MIFEENFFSLYFISLRHSPFLLCTWMVYIWRNRMHYRCVYTFICFFYIFDLVKKRVKPYEDLLCVQLTSYATFSTNEAMHKPVIVQKTLEHFSSVFNASCNKYSTSSLLPQSSSTSSLLPQSSSTSSILRVLNVEWRLA